MVCKRKNAGFLSSQILTTSFKMMGTEPPPPPESRASMIQQAKQELQMLEAQQPNKFNYLKLELNQFITQMEILESVDLQNSTSYATTQASTTGRKERSFENIQESLPLPIVICLPCPEKIQRREKDDDDDDDDDKGIGGSKHKFCRVNSCEWYERMDRVDEVIRRAQACLLKIQQFKTEFCNDGG